VVGPHGRCLVETAGETPVVRARPEWTFPGFETVATPGAIVLARPEAVGWVRFALDGGRTLHDAAAAQRNAFQLEGRRPLFVIPAKVSGAGNPDGPSRRGELGGLYHPEESSAADDASRGGGDPGRQQWVVRHYARGGKLLPRILGDRYIRLGSLRPFHELEASEEARGRGIPTPRVVAAAVYPSGPIYRGDLVTVFVPQATDLVATLFDSARKGVGGALERRDALHASGALIRQMASGGLRHRDLHAGNILLQWRGAAPLPLLVDLDRCRVMREGVTTAVGPMYRRLLRSLRKWERRTGLRISESEWETLERALTE
jgi:3-deoxy-D-manno-octulosonic acid kinase